MNQGFCLANEKITDEVLGQLECLIRGRLQGRIHDFRLLPRGQGLVLQGHARSYYIKQLAQTELMAVADFPIAANEIEVR